MALFARKSRSTAPRSAPPAPRGATAAGLEESIQHLGRELLDRARQQKTGLLSAAFWSDKLMDWAMQDDAFKVQLFRFVDAFPRLRTPEDVHEHLADYLGQPGVTMPPGLGLGLKAGGVFKGAMTKTISSRITGMAEKFIAGHDAESALPVLEKLWQRGIAYSVDLLGEACVSQREAEMYQQKYLDLVETLPRVTAHWTANPALQSDDLGPIPRTNVSIKITALHAETDPIDTEGSIRATMDAIAPILTAAARGDVLINFDMEQSSLKDLTLELFMRCCETYDFTAGLAMQAYLRSGDDDARRIIEWSKRTGRIVTVRLVKGAYWDYETINAEAMDWPVPVWSRKSDTDACFERMATQFIHAHPKSADEGGIRLALGSHNARSIAHALALLDERDLPRNAIELQMLHGMGEELKAASVDMGLRVREYVPVGEMIPGMAYLVRRLLENTSNESWLRAGFAENADAASLLASPHQSHDEPDPGVARIEEGPERHALSVAVDGLDNGRPFMSAPMRDFSQRNVRETFATAIARATVPARAVDATTDDAERSLSAAHAAAPSWRDRPVRERAEVLVRAANLMAERRDELCGVIIREAGKTWREADGEICEAIDFCRYYAREAVPRFEPERLGRFIGELNEIVHEPRGVAVVISPWNFPFAILGGMTVAALVTGNPAIMKPAEQTVGIGRAMFDLLIEAGCPRDVLHFVPGDGESVGRMLVRDPRTALIAFTGSKAVGLDIIGAAGHVADGQSHVKHVVCEMGGKNATIIDASADLDEAVLGVRHAAFGYQGQKCSACSRAIVLASTYDEFVERLCAATESLRLGDPLDPSIDLGPVIDDDAAANIRSYIEIGRKEATLALGMSVPDTGLVPDRAYVAPHIFTDVAPEARIAREEIFGPVLAVIRVDTFDEALRVANDSAYRLTGGIYSRKPEHIDRARREFRVGNLYINKPSTGALVARQPFGGFGMSGLGTKAGGAAYLDEFVVPRAICENTMRRGFAPEL